MPNKGFVEVRASAIAFLLPRKWARPGCSVQHHEELGLALTSHAAIVLRIPTVRAKHVFCF